MKLTKNFKVIYGIVGVLFIVGLTLKFSLNIWGVYTVGKIYRISLARGTKVSYEFYLDGKRYAGMITEPMRDENNGRPFFIHFLRVAPSINLLLPEKPADNCFYQYRNKVLDTLPICE